VQNVVTYDVVVNVNNPEFLLKPGMTANVTIVTARRDSVVRVPIEAIRFHPRSVAREQPASGADTQLSGRSATVFVPDGSGVQPVSLTIGLSDGAWVQMVNGPLKPGDLVVTEETRNSASAQMRPPGMRLPH
jgi:HlyD family secretion protein